MSDGPEKPWWTRTAWLRSARGVLRAAALLTPGPVRKEWLEEWEGELWALDARGVPGRGLLGFAFAGVADAARVTIRREGGDGMTMTDVGREVRMAVRRLLRAPGFTAVTVAVLALGIGANTALFGALQSVLLSPPPYPEPGRLVVVDALVGERGEEPDSLAWSWPKYEAVRDRMDFLAGSAAYMRWNATLAGTGDPVRIDLELVSPSYFGLLGVEPEVGRLLQPHEAPPASPRAVVLAWDTWWERFGGDPGVVGRRLELAGEPFTVVGVARERFAGLTGSAALWVSIADAPVIWEPQRLERAWSHWFRVVGRLESGIDERAATSAAETLGPGLAEAFPAPGGRDLEQGVALTPLPEARVNPTARLAVGAVGVGAVLLLLIAVANVAGLFLARMSARSGDLAVRAAMGAGRGRLTLEVLAETMLLAVGGGLGGLALALVGQGAVRWAVTWALDTSGSRGLQFLDPSTLVVDPVVLAVGLGLALLTGLALGIAPARAVGRTGLAAGLEAAGRRSSARRRGQGGSERVRGVLVATQLALTLVILSGAGLMLASFARLDAVALGFRPEGVLTARYELGPGVPPDEVRAFEVGLVERLEALPAVEQAATAVCSPLAGLCDVTSVREVDGRADDGSFEDAWMHTQTVAPGYFETAGIQVVRGQPLPEGLLPEDPVVTVINRAAAERWFSGEDPVGRRIGVSHELTPEGRPAEIVGIAENVAYQELEEAAAPTVYFSSEQYPSGWGQILVRTSGEPEALAGELRRAVTDLRPGMAVFDVTTLEARKAAATARTRVILGLLVAFGVTALLLSAVGLWGLVSYSVTRRTREMGLRMALGADRRSILRRVAAEPVTLASLGALAGLAGALWVNRYLAALLFQVEPGSPLVMAASAVVLMGVAALAAVIPARRATRIDPSEALRSE